MRGYTVQHLNETGELENTHVRGDISFQMRDRVTGLYQGVRVEQFRDNKSTIMMFKDVLCYFREDHLGQWKLPASSPDERFDSILQIPDGRP